MCWKCCLQSEIVNFCTIVPFEYMPKIDDENVTAVKIK